MRYDERISLWSRRRKVLWQWGYAMDPGLEHWDYLITELHTGGLGYLLLIINLGQ